ncbi:ABC-type dipeptide/oligopeptide/nickel transport system, permease component [Halogeometricum borinquense DSM 11551]|uniref:ABC-type dipeptide/oligopeptide/nickel transport system, permease component n=2 Tax=Halogeometricum borinquense TaxID=60847 RepID=E4NW39_HALBP|nr:hypothetical protein [Halogeometricum borinquense]ADQ69259.1 ABC-type dipeptide/oligopeptide/nickel transport system, permease component [Halogeometricum borinquense DSM 11551]ELY31557.1 ABC-type dipeptide/oligopeptide/nickel transport system, permease component [Halogeometricum borinquense DSM 11551]RYJ08340.1 peptide ABC transporter permease [Halogeometricum borinquense]
MRPRRPAQEQQWTRRQQQTQQRQRTHRRRRQPTFTARHRIGTTVRTTSIPASVYAGDADYLRTATEDDLCAATEDYLRAVTEAVITCDPMPKEVAWCSNETGELETSV